MSELKVPNPPLLVAWISLQARLNQPSKCQWSFDQCTNRTLFPSLQTLLRGGRGYVPHRIWGRKFSGILCSFPPRRKISWRILSVPKSCTPFTNSTSHNNQNLHDTVENSHSQNSPTDTTSQGPPGAWSHERDSPKEPSFPRSISRRSFPYLAGPFWSGK
jgi:hypothetical protein